MEREYDTIREAGGEMVAVSADSLDSPQEVRPGYGRVSVPAGL